MLLAIVATASAAGAVPGVSEPGAAPVAAVAPASTGPVDPLKLDRMLATASRQEKETRQKLEAMTQDAGLARAQTIAYGRAYVRRARAGLLPVGGGFEALVDHASALERTRRAAARALRQQKVLQAGRAALEQQLRELEQRRMQLEAQQAALAQASTALMAASDRALAFQRAFSAGAPGGSFAHTAVYGAGAGPEDPVALAAGFGAMKGRLPFPLPGRAEVEAATLPSVPGPGLLMRAPVGSPVRAVFAGRVAFADDYAAYGKTVILDHGDRYYTVSASLAEIGVAVGEDVVAGARVGTVGQSQSGSGLYFEIRRGAETIDSAEWFGI